jgi:hypothetical protein
MDRPTPSAGVPSLRKVGYWNKYERSYTSQVHNWIAETINYIWSKNGQNTTNV